jgi:glycosyltransferase involved in cell wall biosynthesis
MLLSAYIQLTRINVTQVISIRYGLNILEALAAGKPTITTDYSGNKNFFDKQVKLNPQFERRV